MNLSDGVARAIRTYVPIVVGFVLTWAATTLHVVVGPSSEAGLVALCVTLTTSGYYAIARLLEHHWPRLSVLLGAPKPTKPKD